MVQVAGNDGLNTSDPLALHSESELQSTLTKQQLRHRQPHAADDDVNDSILDDSAHEKETGKPKKSYGAFHYRKNSNASDDGNGNGNHNGSHGFLPGLMKKVGFGSQEFKEKDIHAAESHGSHGSHGFLPGLMKKAGFGSQEFKEKDMHAADSAHHTPGMPPRSGSQGFLPGLMKKAGFGSQEFKEKDMHGSEHSSHGLMGFIKRVGSQEFKNSDGSDHHHHHTHHPHGTRDKEIFGSEDADGNYREHEDLFGYRDMTNPQNIEKANSLFGFEDTEFERGEKGRDLFGYDDPNTDSFREKMDIVGAVNADAAEVERTRHVFGDENAEDSDDEVGSDGVIKRDTKVHNGHSATD